ncbi:MAG: hypothetical protein HY879_23575 [Deltaproteobacteria bacterium]|nr:hypothetical protein [Deltaproteobacteria bacterium]
MKINSGLMAKIEERRGATAIMAGIMLFVLVAISALAIDVGYILASRNELQNIADASALAAASQLGSIYAGMTYDEQQAYLCDPSTLIAMAKDIALKNKAAGLNISIADGDVIVGVWDKTNRVLTPTLNHPDAVSVTARRDNSANGKVATFFASVFGQSDVPLSAVATASLTGQGTALPGGVPLPIGISKARVEAGCPNNGEIQFAPTGTWEGCAGWMVYDTSPASDSKLRAILDGLTNGTYQSPATYAGSTYFNFIGGELSTNTFEAFQNLFDAMKIKNDGTMDADNDPNSWTSTLVVYDRDDCSNPNQSIKIVGFTTVTIYEVTCHPKSIKARFKCDYIDLGRGGGGNSGNIGTIPGLVK